MFFTVSVDLWVYLFYNINHGGMENVGAKKYKKII